ncbi:MAG: crossover junction endodeoxyribonuclease RuvC [Kineosporiaceae bacterium]
MRVLAVDPGLTRCGVAVLDGGSGHRARLVHVGVLRTSPDDPSPQRLLAVHDGLDVLLREHAPTVVAVERVFSQHNVRTVMATAQVSGIVLLVAARAGLDVALYTPSEVKAAVTGAGRAGKGEVQAAVARILGLAQAPRPADAADAVALGICHAWRGRGLERLAAASLRARLPSPR